MCQLSGVEPFFDMYMMYSWKVFFLKSSPYIIQFLDLPACLTNCDSIILCFLVELWINVIAMQTLTSPFFKLLFLIRQETTKFLIVQDF